MNTQTYLPNFTTALNELVDAGRSVWNHNRMYLDSAVATTQDKLHEIVKRFVIGIALLLLTTACLAVAMILGSIAVAEKLMTSLSTPLSQVDSLLIVSSFWLVLTIAIGWSAFNVLSAIKNHLGAYGNPTVK